VVKISRTGRAYRDAVRSAVMASGIGLITGPISVERILYCPDKRRRDIDNTAKALYDAVGSAGLWEDDSMIVSDRAEKRIDPDGVGRVLLQITVVCSDVYVSRSGAWMT